MYSSLAFVRATGFLLSNCVKNSRRLSHLAVDTLGANLIPVRKSTVTGYWHHSSYQLSARRLLDSLRSGVCGWSEVSIQTNGYIIKREENGKSYSQRLYSTFVNMPEPKTPFERLPKTIVPKHYTVELRPNLKTFVFDGSETVKIQVVETTEKIVLNSLDLELRNIEFITSDGKSLQPVKVELSQETETATFVFSKALQVGMADLKIEFTGELNDKMKGFYRSKYKSPEGEERFAGVTQFEATDARRCFPCWDEPSIKATFDISVVVPKDRVALSNMPIISETTCENDPGLHTVKFDTTPIMSTYLTAVIVGEYDYVEGLSEDGVQVRVYTPIGKKEQGLFALEVVVKALPYYRDYFHVAYPLPKMDIIAIADFSSGAMENWGLVTCREICLLVDPENTSAVRKQWIALVVGHELAHQWFGNLVTMEWWTHLWLNEGYASFVEFLCVEHLFPEYNIWTQFVTDIYIRALELDCLKNSHPIEVPVGHPSEVDEIFDDISYNKGASVIRMLHKYIGDEDFKKGMNLYLTKHQYKNTYTEDLWSALEEASKKPVGAVMSSWTKQMGFPVIQVQSRQDGNKRMLTLTQEKFCADGCVGSDNTLWMVPLAFSTSRSPTDSVKHLVLEEKSIEVTLDNISEEEWVKVNPGTIGYYRTQYPPEMLAQLVPAIKDKTLPPLDRLGLLDDLFAMVQAGHTPTVEALKLLEAYNKEESYTVWNSINNIIGKLSLLFSHTNYHDLFKAYVREIMSNVAAKLGWEPKKDESHLDTLLRTLVIGRMGTFGDEATVAEAKKRFEQHVSGEATLPADLRSPVYKTVMSVGNEKTYETMLKLYREADMQEEKDRISRALASIKDKAILRRVLDFAMSEEVRSQDTVFVIISVAISKVGRDIAWQFFKDHHQELKTRYPGGSLIIHLVKYVTENYASEERAQEVETFFQEHSFPGTERTVQQSVESIRLNAAWLKRDSQSVKMYLTKRQ